MKLECDKLQHQVQVLRGEIYLNTAGIFDYDNPAEDSVALSEKLKKTKAAYKALVKDKKATRSTTNFTYNGSAKEGAKFCRDMQDMALRLYNSDAENSVLKMKAGKFEAAEKRLNTTRDKILSFGKLINLAVTDEYHRLRLEELSLTAQYWEAKAREKELQKEERERLREERKAEAEIEREREKLEREKTHYLNAIKGLFKRGEEKQVEELQEKIEEIEKGIEDVDYRKANTRAGYVYVISNIGSFGEGMVKIGMTRRLDPMDRVKELGDASVPFIFDVHALFFSKDAVQIESALHKKFAHRRVNMINSRKEFFHVTPAEVREELLKLTGNLLEYTMEPEAEQYRESEALRKTTTRQ